MKFKSPLTQRILISFVVLTTVVSGLFSFGIMAAIDIVEEDLVTAEFNRKFPEILGEVERGQTPKLGRSSTRPWPWNPALPKWRMSRALSMS